MCAPHDHMHLLTTSLSCDFASNAGRFATRPNAPGRGVRAPLDRLVTQKKPDVHRRGYDRNGLL